MDLDYAILADGVSPRPDGKLDIFGAGFDRIFASDVPARHARLALALRVLVSRHEAEHPHRLDVVIQDADGSELGRAHGAVDPVPQEARHQLPAGRQLGLGMVLNFDNLVFSAFGEYQIIIQWDGNEARPPMRLTVAQPVAE